MGECLDCGLKERGEKKSSQRYGGLWELVLLGFARGKRSLLQSYFIGISVFELT